MHDLNLCNSQRVFTCINHAPIVRPSADNIIKHGFRIHLKPNYEKIEGGDEVGNEVDKFM